MKINLELVDEIIEKFWNDDKGEFNYKGVFGNWELIDTKWEDENKEGDIKQYVFSVIIKSIDNKNVNEHYIYKLNNLTGSNELFKD